MSNLNQNSQIEPEFATMNVVVMKKHELLKELVKNKAKHDTLYEVSVSGYWELAETALEQKRKTLNVCVKDLKDDVNYSLDKVEQKIKNREKLPSNINYDGFTWSSSLPLTYPENHSQDYERAIRMMSASIYDEVKLSVTEFDQYVLNNWAWRSSFLSTSNYITTVMTGCFTPSNLCSGMAYYGTSSLATDYDNSVSSFSKDIQNKSFTF